MLIIQGLSFFRVPALRLSGVTLTSNPCVHRPPRAKMMITIAPQGGSWSIQKPFRPLHPCILLMYRVPSTSTSRRFPSPPLTSANGRNSHEGGSEREARKRGGEADLPSHHPPPPLHHGYLRPAGSQHQPPSHNTAHPRDKQHTIQTGGETPTEKPVYCAA